MYLCIHIEISFSKGLVINYWEGVKGGVKTG